MVVLPEPAVKGFGAFAAGAVDRAVGPAVDQGAYEAFCFPVGLRPIRTGAQVADAERATNERVDRAAVAAAVVGEHAFDGDPVSAVESDRTPEEAGRSGCLLVGQHLGIREAAVVVDGDDVHVLPADGLAHVPGRVSESPVVVLAAAVDAPAGASLDPAQLFDVDVEQLARPRAFVADGRLEPETTELAHPRSAKNARDGGESHPERLRDLSGGKAQTAQHLDRLDPLGRSSIRDPTRRRRTIVETELALTPVTTRPLPSPPRAAAGGLARRRQRPSLFDNEPHKTAPTLPAESRVTV